MSNISNESSAPEEGLSASGDGADSPVVSDKRGTVAGVAVHSFVVIPLLIALVCVLSFTSFRVLVGGEKDAFQLLNDIQDGNASKRWRAAYQLSSVLNREGAIPETDAPRFHSALGNAFDQAKHDPDPLARQYLALAMGRSGWQDHAAPLMQALEGDGDANLPYIIHALGMLADPSASPLIRPFIQHRKPAVRLQAVIAAGNLHDIHAKEHLRKALTDSESNVRWDAAVALAKMGDPGGSPVLLQLLSRSYLAGFGEVDAEEEVRILLTALEAGAMLDDLELNAAIQGVAEHDPNMEVRRTAIELLRKRAEGQT